MIARISRGVAARPSQIRALLAARVCQPISIALAVFVLAAALVAGLIWRQERYRLRDARGLAATLAAEQAFAMQSGLERALSATYALSAIVRQGWRSGSEDRLPAIAGLLRDFPGSTMLQLARGGVVRQVAPADGHEAAIAHDLLGDPLLGATARRARDTGQLTIAGPYAMDGGLALAGCLPIFVDEAHGQHGFWGLAIAVIAVHEIAAPVRLAELVEHGYGYEVLWSSPDSHGAQLIARSASAVGSDPVERVVPVANASLILRLAPPVGWGDVPGLLWQSLVGLLFCALLAWQAGWQTRLAATAKAHERNLERRVAQRTADLQRFAEVTAHHLQEPARRMVSYAGRLKGQLAGRLDDPEANISLDFIGQQAGRLQELLRDVELYLAADQPRGRVESCDAEQTVAALLSRLAESIGEAGARVRVGPLPRARIDAPRLGDMFRVALENALDHGRSENALCIEIDGSRSGDLVRYRVSDNGPGVEPEYRARVFRVFERLSASGEGTGIGLALLQRIAESIGGHAWIEEAPGGGCQVVLELPAGEENLAPEGRS
ncbi:ATP-binding protein [Accumulibacter sp.]|uniref:sensor histidine kinase n=1 Tax=Accumulibacter sp. TaxID=2053492 RepID=UPI0025CDAB36|nr:ATP-binding protein [Accumulibacter sp.]MCM8596966.1 ATP-binding protein [Accumulibacter sp.]MCM8624460.1 ATP-binding protein [Accumulibacter sp.]MDS4051115.1 ATP-binding protein [Accumulibacter sp.]